MPEYINVEKPFLEKLRLLGWRVIDQRNGDPLFSPENRQAIASMLAEFAPVAAARNVTLSQLVIAWTLAQPGCSHALLGARTPEQAIENAVAGNFTLSQKEVSEMTGILRRFEGKLSK